MSVPSPQIHGSAVVVGKDKKKGERIMSHKSHGWGRGEGWVGR